MEPNANAGTGVGSDLTAEVDLRQRRAPTDLHDPEQRADVERTVGAIPGVLGARLVPGYDRPVDELHVLTSLDKSPKSAVRDVQTVLMARYGLSMDHRVVSVAQLDERDAPMRARERVAIDRVGVSHAGARLTVEVVLRDGEQRLVGRAEGSAGAPGRHRATAQAALDAAAPLIDPAYVVELIGAEVLNLMGHQVAVSLVHLHAGRSGITLAGSAMVRDAEADAVARSILDALNRTIDEDAG